MKANTTLVQQPNPSRMQLIRIITKLILHNSKLYFIPLPQNRFMVHDLTAVEEKSIFTADAFDETVAVIGYYSADDAVVSFFFFEGLLVLSSEVVFEFAFVVDGWGFWFSVRCCYGLAICF